MGLLLASLINKEPLIFIAIIVFAFAGTVFWAKIPLGKYLKMLTVPFAFLFTSILAISFFFFSGPIRIYMECKFKRCFMSG